MSQDKTGLPTLIKLLANEVRWNIIKVLIESDYRVYELVELTGQPMNLVSYHLKQLRDDQMVITRRSDADGRDIYYSLDMDRLKESYQQLGMILHPTFLDQGMTGLTDPIATPNGKHPATRILILCTHNSARSQMAEGLMRHLGGNHVEVHSAGNHPTAVRQDAIETMAQMDIDISKYEVNHIDEYLGQHFDYVITVCDLAREVCPTFPGGKHLHWGLQDPTTVADATERHEAYRLIAERLKSRIRFFLETIIT